MAGIAGALPHPLNPALSSLASCVSDSLRLDFLHGVRACSAATPPRVRDLTSLGATLTGSLGSPWINAPASLSLGGQVLKPVLQGSIEGPRG